jgi:AcrR family transcriptional regulator
MPTDHTTAPGPPRRRADAERSIARILDAAVDALAGDPEASMAEIARRAGVVRATIYVHFPTREVLLEAVTHRAIAEVAEVIHAAEPHRGDPAEALARLVAASWRTLGRYHALVAINTQQHGHAALRQRHSSILAALEPLIERGQADGAFRADVPAAWHLSMLMALMHAASGELGAGRVNDTDAGPALVTTVLGAVAPSTPPADPGDGTASDA